MSVLAFAGNQRTGRPPRDSLTTRMTGSPIDNEAVQVPDGRTDSLKSISRNAFVYGLGIVASRLASFIMLPVYTHQLSTADYGLLQLLQLTVDVVAIASTAGATAGVLRFYFKTNDLEERERIVSTAFFMLVGLGIFGGILLAIASPYIWHHFLDNQGRLLFLYLTALTFVIDSASAVPLVVLQAEERPWWFVIVLFAKLVTSLSLNILFLVVLHLGVLGVVLSTLAASTLVAVVTATWLLRRTGFKWSKSAARDLRRFGIPYQLSTAGTFVLAFGDRFFLQAHRGPSEVGLYSLAYQFGFLLSGSVALPFLRAWAPLRLRVYAERPQTFEEEDNASFLVLSVLCLTAVVGISVAVEPFLRIMATSEYQGASQLVPWVLFAYLFQVWTDVVSFGAQVSERTKWVTISTWIGVAVIVLLYSTLIPLYGAYGAALATLFGFASRFVAQLVFSQRIFPLRYHWATHTRLFGVAVVAIVADRAYQPPSLSLRVVYDLVAFAAYCLAMWRLALGIRERAAVKEGLHPFVERIQGWFGKAERGTRDRALRILHAHAPRDNLGDALLVHAIQQTLRKLCAPRPVVFRSLANDGWAEVPLPNFLGFASTRVLLKELESANAVVMGGGEIVGPFPSYNSLALASVATQRPLLWLGVGSAQFRDGGRLQQWYLRQMLASSQAVLVRDPKTLEDMTGVVPAERLRQAPDLAFSWEPPIDVRQAAGTSAQPIVALALRGPETRERMWGRSEILGIAEAIRPLLARGYRIQLHTFLGAEAVRRIGSPNLASTFQSDQDLNAVISEALQSDAVETLEATSDIGLVARRIAASELLIGMRLHSLILSTIVGTPFIALDYARKVREFARAAADGSVLIRPDEVATRLPSIVDLLLREDEQAARRAGLLQFASVARFEAEAAMRPVADLLLASATKGVSLRQRARAHTWLTLKENYRRL